MIRLRGDPDGFARELARPMPRPPSPAARFGTRFHAWVEARFGQQKLFDPDDLPGRGDLGIDAEDDLGELIAHFERGPFADRVPPAVEAPFALVLAGQVVRGRIDAVYAEPGGGYLVVDWKTNVARDADPLQLALYRLAWAELAGVPLERVRAAFHYVRSGRRSSRRRWGTGRRGGPSWSGCWGGEAVVTSHAAARRGRGNSRHWLHENRTNRHNQRIATGSRGRRMFGYVDGADRRRRAGPRPGGGHAGASLLVAGEWITGRVVNHDGHGVALLERPGR